GSQCSRDEQFCWGASWAHRWDRGTRCIRWISRQRLLPIGRGEEKLLRLVVEPSPENTKLRQKEEGRREEQMQASRYAHDPSLECEPHRSKEREKSVTAVDVAEAIAGGQGGSATGYDYIF